MIFDFCVVFNSFDILEWLIMGNTNSYLRICLRQILSKTSATPTFDAPKTLYFYLQ